MGDSHEVVDLLVVHLFSIKGVEFLDSVHVGTVGFSL